MSSTDQNRSRKILVPLATMAVAAAVVVGSGATWTSTSTSTVSVTAGHILHSNTAKNLTLTIDAFKPGDVATGELTITNTGDVESVLNVTQDNSSPKTVANTFADVSTGVSDLHLVMKRDGQDFYNGNFGGFTSKSFGQLNDLSLTKGEQTTITFVVSLNKKAAESDMGQTAAASFQFDTVPVAGESLLPSWK